MNSLDLFLLQLYTPPIFKDESAEDINENPSFEEKLANYYYDQGTLFISKISEIGVYSVLSTLLIKLGYKSLNDYFLQINGNLNVNSTENQLILMLIICIGTTGSYLINKVKRETKDVIDSDYIQIASFLNEINKFAVNEKNIREIDISSLNKIERPLAYLGYLHTKLEKKFIKLLESLDILVSDLPREQ